MKKIFKLLFVFVFAIFLFVGCGKEEKVKETKEIDYDSIVDKIEQDEPLIQSYDNYYNPRDFQVIVENVSGRLNTSYYDFDKDGDVEFLVSRVKDNSIVLTLYDVENEELKELDSIVLFDDYLGFPDIIYLDCFVKVIDDVPYIYAESLIYGTLVSDGLSWDLKKIGFSDNKFFDIAKKGISGSYIEDDYLKSIKEFVEETGLKISNLNFEENGKSLFEQNKENSVRIFYIERTHLDDFTPGAYYNSKETNVKYGYTNFYSDNEKNSSLADYIK